MPTTIDELQIQIETESQSASTGIQSLSNTLATLKNSCKGGFGLNRLANQVTALDTSLKSVDAAGSSAKIDTLANSISKLSGLGQIKISSTIGNQLKNIGLAATGLNGMDFSGIGRLSDSLKPLADLGKSQLNSFINQIKKLPETIQTLNGIDFSAFKAKIDELVNTLQPLADVSVKISNGFNQLPSKVNAVTNATTRYANANKNASGSAINLWAKFRMAKAVMQTTVTTIAGWITQSNAYIENLNLFTASMGEYASEAQKYAESVSEAMGIDPSDWLRAQGIFNTIITGFGVGADKAYIMSKNLTQLGYDISSFANISVEDAMTKLQSGISGELEPLRRLGYDLSQARLQATALSLGIEKDFSDMTQAEKSQLRYYTIMKQVTVVQGDMARTLNAPANQLRILQAQVTQAGRALGNIFIPALNATLPYAIALTKVVRMLADAISGLFGFQLPEVDYSGISGVGNAAADVSDSMDDANKKAKELKRTLLGFDQLNVLNGNDSSSGSGSGSGAGGDGFDFELPQYDFLSQLVSSKSDEIVNEIKSMLGEIIGVASAAALAIGMILIATGVKLPLGIALVAVGAIGLATEIGLKWGDMDEKLARTLSIITATVGGFALAVGALLAFSGANVGLGVALMIVGAASIATALAINWNFLNGDLQNTLSILTAMVGGSLLAVGALIAFTGANPGLGIAMMVAGGVALVASVGLNWDFMTEPVKTAITALMNVLGGALLAIGAVMAFSGVNIPLGIAMMAAGAVSLVASAKLDWNGTSDTVSQKVEKLATIIGGASLALGGLLVFSGVGLPLGMGLIAVGATSLAVAAGIDWNMIPDKIKEIVKNLGAYIGGAFLLLGVLLVFTGVGVGFGVALIVAGVSSIVAAAVMNWNYITDKLKQFFKDCGTFIGASLLAIGVILILTGVGIPLGIALIAAGIASITAAAVLNWDEIKNKVKQGLDAVADAFESFKISVSNKIGQVKSKMQEIGSNATEWFTKGEDGKYIWDHFYDAGQWVVEGFKNGVNSLWRSCWSTVTDWAGSVGNWFKNSLGINSPSKLFAEFGGYTVQGFNNGIQDDMGSSLKVMNQWSDTISDFAPTLKVGIDTSAIDNYDPSKAYQTVMTASVNGSYDKTMAMVNDNNATGMQADLYTAMAQAIMDGKGDENQPLNVYIGNEFLDQYIATRDKRNALISGGR
jgi:hypothetical protein